MLKGGIYSAQGIHPAVKTASSKGVKPSFEGFRKSPEGDFLTF